MLDRLEIKNGAQDTNFQLCRLHIDLFHDDFWSGINNGSFLKKIKIIYFYASGGVSPPHTNWLRVESRIGSSQFQFQL